MELSDARARLKRALGGDLGWFRYCDRVRAVLGATSLDERVVALGQLRRVLHPPGLQELHDDYFAALVSDAMADSEAASAQKRERELGDSLPAGLFSCGIPVVEALQSSGMIDARADAEDVARVLWCGFKVTKQRPPSSDRVDAVVVL